MPTVYVTDYTYAHLDYERGILEPLGCTVIGRQCRTAADVIAQCGDAIALLNQYAPLTREVFAALPNLKMVVRYGVGYDSVDVAAATEHGVMVVNVPDYGVQEVADHTLALLLAMVRKIPAIVNDVTAGRWNDNTFHPIMGLAAKTVGLLGFGNIAKEVAKRTQAFNMQVQAYDPFVAADVFATHHVAGVSAETVFATSDIICVHLPLNDQTRHFVGATTLAQMKKTAYLINTARGPLVNYDDLYEALVSEKLGGAMLETFDVEPVPPDNRFLKLSNVTLTPHIAGASVKTVSYAAGLAAEEVRRYLAGEPALNRC